MVQIVDITKLPSSNIGGELCLKDCACNECDSKATADGAKFKVGKVYVAIREDLTFQATSFEIMGRFDPIPSPHIQPFNQTFSCLRLLVYTRLWQGPDLRKALKSTRHDALRRYGVTKIIIEYDSSLHLGSHAAARILSIAQKLITAATIQFAGAQGNHPLVAAGTQYGEIDLDEILKKPGLF